jgi:diguanylate cyclase (GGDEF)-like protein
MPSPLAPPLALIDETLGDLRHPRRYARRFAGEMEEVFQRVRLAERIARFRESLLLGILLYNVFLFTDYQCLRPYFGLCLLVRLGLNTPLALLFMYLISRVGRGVREFLFAFSGIPATLGVIFLCNHAANMLGSAQAVVVLMMLYAINALRPDFRFACVTVPLLAVVHSIYLVSTPLLDKPIGPLYIGITWAAAGLSLLSCYRLELEERIGYLLSLRNQEQNAALARINEELTKISLIDSLTGVPNRRSFNNDFRSAWDRALRDKQPLAVLMMDIDHFKALNDRHGHPYGDSALCIVAHAIRDVLRAEGDILARYGGEEFIALLPNQNMENAQAVAERIRAAVRISVLPPGKGDLREEITISIGVAAVLPTGNARAAELLRAADVALYKAKALGRDCVFPPA